MILASRLEALRRQDSPQATSLKQLEYKVFSQFGDDGIIEHLSSSIPRELNSFVEFGVEDYSESNTRLLLQRDNWRGLVLDGSALNVNVIRSSPYFWRHNLTALQAFITAENIDGLLTNAGFSGHIGILSIDIDGVDFWIWQAIRSITPMIVVCEYNAIFGPSAKVTVPYDPAFVRSEKHYSNLYAGASLGALNHLATQRDMRFLGCNSAGNNAYFAHNSLRLDFESPSIEEGYVRSKFREARDKDGELLLKTARECADLIHHLPVIDVVENTELTVGQALENIHHVSK